MAPTALHPCSTCQDETPFEVVVFDDGTGGDGECACVHCGHAVVVGLRPEPEVVLVAAA